MLYSEFVENTGCRENDYNYTVYKRLELAYMNDDDGRYEAFCNIINEQAFSDAVDVVLFFET